jgi:hypothetical protein
LCTSGRLSMTVALPSWSMRAMILSVIIWTYPKVKL